METGERMKTYQFALTEPECQLFREIRNQRASHGIPVSMNVFQGEPVAASIQVGDRRITRSDINSENAMWELATFGTKIGAACRSGDWSGLPHEEMQKTEHERGQERAPQQLTPDDDRDSVLGTQPVFSQPDSAVDTLSWETIKDQVIPSYVKVVSFTVDPTEVSEAQLQGLRERFPNVTVCLTTPLLIGQTGQGAGVATPDQTPNPHDLRKDEQFGKEKEPEVSKGTFEVKPSSAKFEAAFSSGFHIQGTAAATQRGDQEDPEEHDVTATLVNKVMEELHVTFQSPTEVQNMYQSWIKSGKLEGPRSTDGSDLHSFCINLIDLYIVAECTHDEALAYEILLKWQEASVSNKDFILGLEEIMSVFESRLVSPNSPLRKWIAIFYGFLWTTTDEGTFEKFRENFKHYHHEPPPSEAFLFDIALVRCRETQGLDRAVLERWCHVHDHPDTPDGKLAREKCIAWRDRISELSLTELEKADDDDALDKAKRLVRNCGWTIIPRKSTDSTGLSANTPFGPRGRGQPIKSESEPSPRVKDRAPKRSFEGSSPRPRGRPSKRSRGRGAH
ncbi:hypothetical protein P154DRAFT_518246 [Amniculicola lignicola CBS 123094]|uniref:Uncharacterized protein n=1 Tax=Amniculicola lignicola CBS 123094 TaxID=1392246 RepID=A0A6A5X2P0_9PLEO|nr:hypothetical protein P154DRAFT_518246 [Amniculicola lignicola CBS 123094]